MKKEWKIVCIDLKKMFKSPKIYLLLFFSFFFLRDYVNMNEIKALAEQMNLAVPPAVYPLILGEWSYRLFVFLMLIMLMADVPFQDDSVLYTIQRTGFQKWMNGKILSVFMISVVYQLLFFLLSILILLPDLGFANQWGDVFETVSYNHTQAFASTGNIWSMQEIMNNYTPVAAVLYTFLLSVLIGTMIGLFIFLVNGITKSQAGMVLVLIYGCADLFFDALSSFGYSVSIPLVMSWMDLSKLYAGTYQSGKLSIWTAFVVLLLINSALVYFLKKSVRFRVIKPIE